jgi:segregation and condensation protein A
VSSELRVKTSIFEGPVDLLLTLAQRRELDLNQLRLSELTSEYLESISAGAAKGEEVAPEEMAAFLVVGSRLLALKAAALLPAAGAEDEEEDLEAWEDAVKERMLEYERFKAAAMELMHRHQSGNFTFASAVEAEIIPAEKIEIDGDSLATAFQAVLDRLPPPVDVAVELRPYSVLEEMDGIRSRVQPDEKVSFTAVFEGAESRLHAVIIFLALLELVRRDEVKLSQRQVFGDIELKAGPNLGAPGSDEHLVELGIPQGSKS